MDPGREAKATSDAGERALTIVSGLPRSGTSLMMQMLEAAGLEVARDERRSPDVDNPRGYYELDAVRRLRADASFLADLDGCALKVVAPLVRHLPEGRAYRVLFLERAIDEVLASQRAMLRGHGDATEAGTNGDGETPPDEARLARAFERAIEETKAELAAAPHVSLLVVAHRELVEAPDATCARIARFLDATGGLVLVNGRRVAADEAARRMAAVVDPRLYRQRGAPRAGA